jgi:hypothetical protein
MIEDMTIHRLVPKTQQGYIRNVKAFAAGLTAAGRGHPQVAVLKNSSRVVARRNRLPGLCSMPRGIRSVVLCNTMIYGMHSAQWAPN